MVQSHISTELNYGYPILTD